MNSVGDLVLTDPRALLALASPSRLRLFDTLRRQGPLAVGPLAAAVGEDESSVQQALEEFAECGLALVEDGAWQTAGRGFVFEIPEDPEGQVAGRQLANAALLHYSDAPQRWVDEHEPSLTLEWIRAAGLFQARVAVTPDELRRLQADLELLLEPLTNRDAGDVPDGAATVRIVSYFLPEAAG